MTTRFGASYLVLVASAAAWLLAGDSAQASIRGNAYRATSSIFLLPYEPFYFTEDGFGPNSAPYTEIDYGLFSIWSSRGRRTEFPFDIEIDHLGISLLGLTISGTRAEYHNNAPIPARLGFFSGYFDPRCGPDFERVRIRGFNTSTTAVFIVAEGEPLSAATRVTPNTQRMLDVQLPKGAQEVRFFAVRDTLGYPVVGEGIWRPDPFATTQILWNGTKLICNPEPPLP